MDKKLSIMLVEDDTNLGEMIKDSLELHDFHVELHRDGQAGWENYKKGAFNMLLLDVMMPKKDGFTLAREIRKVDASVPIIFLTAKGMKEDKLEGFTAGADDYLTKPFEIDELILRMEAIFRRTTKGINKDDVKEFQIGGYTFNIESRTLIMGAEEHKLTTKECGLLEQLCLSKDGILERDVALKAVWGNDNYFTGRSMDVYITKIRKYLKSDPSIEIQNVHGEGYRMKF
jgi:two-component system, OmpR family, response regulator